MTRTRPTNLWIAVACGCVGAVAAWSYAELLPVSLTEQRAAQVLARAGPNGAAAYKAAWNDGRLTRSDMIQLRDQAGRDVDAWIAASRSARAVN
ncbi:hypothetical protein ACMGDM_16275 [Sphingomonas sp. DT-51]